MKKKLPNIIIIVMDTCSAKHMSLYGYHRRTTPQMDRLAESGTLYTRCYASSTWTIPSHASLFTGLYSCEHRVDGIRPEQLILNKNIPHLVSILRQSKYSTYGISCNPLVSTHTGLCRDFDVFHELFDASWGRTIFRENEIDSLFDNIANQKSYRNSIKTVLSFLKKVYINRNIKLLKDLGQLFIHKYFCLGSLYNSAANSIRSFELANDLIRHHLGTKGNDPFFMFINVIENHSFYNPPRQYRTFSNINDRQKIPTTQFYKENLSHLKRKLSEICRNLYDDTILFLDDIISKFIKNLEAQNILENTIVMVTSDHGEHFGEKNHYEHFSSLYNEIIWVPLLMFYPKQFCMKKKDDRLISLGDIFSTCLDLIESPFPRPESSCSLVLPAERNSIVAMNLFPLDQKINFATRQLNRSKQWAKDNLVTNSYCIILKNNIKIIEREINKISIYNLENDPNEEHDLALTMNKDDFKDIVDYLNEDKREKGYLNVQSAYGN